MKIIAYILAALMIFQAAAIPAFADEGTGDFVTPQGQNSTYNLNLDWKYKRPGSAWPLKDAVGSEVKDGKSFYDFDFDDSDWETVSVPHAVNASDSFDNVIVDAGEPSLYRGFMLYRKSFVLPESEAGKKAILEFEAVRQTVYLWVNGEMVGYYEAGTAPIGFDITNFVRPGEKNVIAVATDNAAYRGSAFQTQETIPGHEPGDVSGIGYQWNQKDFNEVQGGITGNVNLYTSPKLYQTRPLYNNLKTTGNYIYASDFDIDGKSAVINVKAEVRNETGADANAVLEVYVVDGDRVVTSFSSPEQAVTAASDAGLVLKSVVPADAYDEEPAPTNADTVDVTYISASARAENLRFWSLDDPYLYDVYTVLRSGDIVDVQKITTGFRSVDFNIEKGGLLINGVPTYLRGYAQRSTNEWAVIGVANDWLSDYDMQLVRESGADFIRWMHVSPKPVAIRAGDKYGVVSVCPAGDKEGDQGGRYWDTRVEAMRDAIIYFRNSPSIIFYEGGNAAISAEHMQEMTDIKNLLDPNGGRYMGCRSITSPEQIAAAEWAGTMIYRYDSSAKASMYQVDKQMPIVETEYKRDEAPRRVWDDFSPPDYDYVNKWLGDGAKKTDGYDIWDLNQEDMSVTLASDGDGYAYFYNNRVGGPTGNDYYSAAAMMVWSDSNMHGRNSGSENARTSGRVDPVRIKKENFYAVQAMQDKGAKIHIVGHWNYPENTDENYTYYDKTWNGTYWEYNDTQLRRDPTHKTVYVVGSELCDKIELYINGSLVGECSTPRDTFVFEFPDIDVTQSGEISAVAYSDKGKVIAIDKIETVGEPAAIRLTPVTGPEGLRADGSDVCYIDVEVVDTEGRVCPLNYDRIDFTFDGAGTFLGGYNSGTYNETSVIHKDYCYAECGTNRVFVQSSPEGGSFKLTAVMEGLPAAEVSLEMTPFELDNGLTAVPQQAYAKNTPVTKPETMFDRLVAENIANAAVRNRAAGAKKYTVINVGTGKALAVIDGGLAYADIDEGNSAFVWGFNPTGTDTFNLKNSASGMSIDVPGLSTEDGRELIVYATNSGDNQKWRVETGENGLSTITSVSSGLTLDGSGEKIAQRSADGSAYQQWRLTEVTERDEYKVLVNGTEVQFNTKPYRPDSSSGVLCELRPVLDAIGADYSYQIEGELPDDLASFSLPMLTLTASGAVVVCGETAIHRGEESNLTNAEFYAENGELIAEIAPLIGYIDGAEIVTDAETKTVNITI
ncbi:MAG: RICIN domain-containing protein [Oscillospiraceae bacterium]|nr:RICIN domain-containing protein [Oscillospiraceae bacterium]